MTAPLSIVYAAPEYVVVNKPAGMLAQPGLGPAGDDCVLTRLSPLLAVGSETFLVHRLDMDTSGLMVVATSKAAQSALSRQFAQRRVEKTYVALLDGPLHGDRGMVRLPFRLDVHNRPRQIYDPMFGKVGETRWRKLPSAHSRQSRVEFVPLTGRTHQLRVHAAHPLGLGQPILGDELYGTKLSAPRLMLHAQHLAFSCPTTQANVSYTAQAPF